MAIVSHSHHRFIFKLGQIQILLAYHDLEFGGGVKCVQEFRKFQEHIRLFVVLGRGVIDILQEIPPGEHAGAGFNDAGGGIYADIGN